jgi:Flp pilus assembly protein TadG
MNRLVIQEEREPETSLTRASHKGGGGSGVSWLRRRRSRGNAMLEVGLMMIPFLALMFGIFDYAIVVFLRNTMQFAVREGVRYAITSQTIAGLGHDGSIKQIVMNNSMGFANLLSPTNNGLNQITVTYYNPATLTVVSGVNSNVGGNIVVVAATGLRWQFMAPVLHRTTPMTFDVSSAGMMEATPVGGPPAR